MRGSGQRGILYQGVRGSVVTSIKFLSSPDFDDLANGLHWLFVYGAALYCIMMQQLYSEASHCKHPRDANTSLCAHNFLLSHLYLLHYEKTSEI